jgi:hypothetical protein
VGAGPQPTAEGVPPFEVDGGLVVTGQGAEYLTGLLLGVVHAAWHLLASTGLRRGEALGLGGPTWTSMPRRRRSARR